MVATELTSRRKFFQPRGCVRPLNSASAANVVLIVQGYGGSDKVDARMEVRLSQGATIYTGRPMDRAWEGTPRTSNSSSTNVPTFVNCGCSFGPG